MVAKELAGADYWNVIAQIDFLYYELEQMCKKMVERPAITQMIDEATGYDKKMDADAREVVAQIKELQAMLPADDPHFIKKETT